MAIAIPQLGRWPVTLTSFTIQIAQRLPCPLALIALPFALLFLMTGWVLIPVMALIINTPPHGSWAAAWLILLE